MGIALRCCLGDLFYKDTVRPAHMDLLGLSRLSGIKPCLERRSSGGRVTPAKMDHSVCPVPVGPNKAELTYGGRGSFYCSNRKYNIIA